MPRWSKITLKIVGILFGLIILLWIGVAAYVQTNKKDLLKKITEQINENINGEIQIRDMEPALVQGFPGVSVSLKDVLLRDSLWNSHHHDLIKAKNLFVAINIFSIIRGNPSVRNLTFSDGEVYLFTDTSGYSNTNLFKRKSAKTNTDDKETPRKKINRIDFERVNVTVENLLKKNYYNFAINKLQSKFNYNSDGWDGNLKMDVVVKNFAFNTKNGSFLKDKRLITNLNLSFEDDPEVLSFPLQGFKIGDYEFEIGGQFGFSKTNSLFNLTVIVPEIGLKDAADLLANNIASKINRYSLKNPLYAKAIINGDLNKKGDPHINVFWKTQNNQVYFNGMKLDKVSFDGEYNNEIIAGKGRNDENSHISFYKLKGQFSTIPISADTVRITNLKDPLISGRFASEYPLTKLNNVYAGNTFVFTDGVAKTNLLYKAPFNPKDNGPRYIKGVVQISNAAVKYVPRNMYFKNGNVKLNFKGRDLQIEDMSVQSGSNKLKMTGYIKDLSNFYYSDPEKIVIDWNIYSPQINLSEFIGFLSSRKSAAAKPTPTGSSSTVDNFENLLALGSARLKMKIDKAIYNRFVATDVTSVISLNQNGIVLNNVSLKNAGGSLKISGNILQNGAVNKVNLKTDVDDANVRQLFYSFNNFGQDGISYTNLRGQLDAKTDITATIKDDGTVVPGSIRGTVAFNLKNGALVNFEPLQKIGDFAFKNRNFSNITFSNLSNTLTFNGSTVTIPPMQIASNVLNIFFDGVYGFKSGTNLNLSVPLRNPEKDKDIADKEERRERAKKGIVINLHAVDGDDGKVKFKLGRGD